MEGMLRRHIESIAPLTDAEFSFIRAQFTAETYKKHQCLIREGQPVRFAYFVLSGLLKLVYTDDNGKYHIVSFAIEGWWGSDFQALYGGTNATMSLISVEDTEVLCLSVGGYQTLCNGLRKMERYFLNEANACHIEAQERILSLLTTSAKERYEQLLHQSPSLLQRVPKTLLASYLGVSRETLSRLSS